MVSCPLLSLFVRQYRCAREGLPSLTLFLFWWGWGFILEEGVVYIADSLSKVLPGGRGLSAGVRPVFDLGIGGHLVQWLTVHPGRRGLMVTVTSVDL